MLMSLSALWTLQDLWLLVEGLILPMSVFYQVCRNAILDAARKIALNGMSNTDGFPVSLEHSTRIDDCKNIVLQWMASKLDPSSANSVLRRLSNCNVNKD
jgi:hypothetical protein